MSNGRIPVTVVIAARNEASEIGECIASVGWADEVLVVENDSVDGTLDVARAAGATVFTHPFRSIGAQRNAAIERARHPWILVLDADERATPEVATAVATAIGAPGTLKAWRVRRRNFFQGREIRHGGWERDRPVRLFSRALRYDERPVHEHVIVPGVAGVLDAPLLHIPYASLDEYFEKLHRYSAWWARQAYARGRRASVIDLLFRPPARFLTMYVLRLGFLDGLPGLVVALLGSMSVAAKYGQLRATQRPRT